MTPRGQPNETTGNGVAIQRQMKFWLAALVVFILILWLLSEILLPFIAGLAIAYLLTPLTDRLERMGLITSAPAAKGNARVCDLTADGEALVAKLVPLWVKAQTEMRQLLSAGDFSTTLGVLKRLSRV